MAADQFLIGTILNDSLIGGDGNDTLIGLDGDDFLDGGTGNDLLVGNLVGEGSDTLLGGAGSDTLFGAEGNDSLDGGADGDMLVGGGGDDSLQGGDGSDTIFAGEGTNQLFGGLGNDFLIAGGGGDLLEGGDGIDVLVGGAGNDTLYGGADTDLLSGGTGADVLVAGEGNDWVEVNGLDLSADGGEGIIDMLLIVGSTAGLSRIDLGRLENQNATGSGPVLTGFEGVDAFSALAGVEILGAVHDGGFGNLLSGSAFGDTIFGSAAVDIIAGRQGDDILSGGGGNDTIDGGEGIDTAVFSGRRADYEITESDAGVVVRAVAGGDGTYTLTGVELLQFADQIIDIGAGIPLPGNLPPIVGVDPITTFEDTPFTFRPLANDVDPEGGPLSVAGIVSLPAYGAVSLNANGTLTYTPVPNFYGDDVFLYRVVDEGGASAVGTVTITVKPVNDAPVALADTVSTYNNHALVFRPTLNDRDVDGDALTISSIVTAPQHGTVTINADNSLTYTPAADYLGSDSLVYRISDEAGATADARVSLAVSLFNDPPIAVDDAVATLPNAAVTFAPLANDFDSDGNAITLTGLAAEPVHGSVTINADGTFTYTPAPGYTGTDSLAYTIADGRGGTAQGTVDLTIGIAEGGSGGGGSSGGTGGGSGGGNASTDWIHGNSVVAMADPSQPGDVVGVRIQNLTATSGSGQVVTFGEVFLDGEIAAGSHLMARVGGQLVPVQMDVKTTYADGSVKHAVLSVAPAALGGNGSAEMMLTTAGAGASGAALTVGDVLTHGYDLKVEVDLHDGHGARVVDAAQVLSQAIQSGHVETWMSGPLASEFRVETTVAGDLKARLDIRLTADGGIKTDVILAREATYVNSPTYMQNITYDATIRSNGAVVAQYNNVTHLHNATWHEEVWSGARAQVNVVHDVDHLLATGAVPAYDSSLGVSAAALGGLSTGNTDPMGAGTVTTNMSQTGGRPDIGPLPTWTAQYLLSQDPKAAAAMLANADAAGSIPWHLVDEATGDPVRLDQHPGLWVDSRQAPGSSADALPKTYSLEGTGWAPDTAHEPSLTYVPYLVTGSHYYLDELQAQASFNMASQPTIYRTHTGVDFFSQLRAEAWDLRTLGQVAFITPDGDAMKSYFNAALTKELGKLVSIYVTGGALDSAGQTEGWFKADYPPDAVAPWQQDYMALTLAQLAGEGFTQADTLLQWAENYLAGRFLNADNGYNPFEGAAYYLQINDPATGHLINTWEAFYRVTFGTNVRSEISEYPNAAGGYAAGARGALAGLFNVTHSVDSLAAYGYVVSQTQNAGMAQDYANNPTFFEAPHLPDGSILAVGDMKVASGSGPATLTAGARPSLLYGGPGNDVITGGPSSDVLFGGGGNDTIKGGPGNDYLYGGKGDDRLEGGPGADTFVFDKVNAGHDVIADFKPGEDRIVFGTANVANQGLTAAGLIAGATTDSSGNLVLHPGEGSDITLVGVHTGELSTTDIAVE